MFVLHIQRCILSPYTTFFALCIRWTVYFWLRICDSFMVFVKYLSKYAKRPCLIIYDYYKDSIILILRKICTYIYIYIRSRQYLFLLFDR